MSVGYKVWNKPAGQAAQPGLARLADHAFVHPSIDAHDKARFAATRACLQGRANVARRKTRRVEHALRLIPPFHICRSLVRADLRADYGENRLNRTHGAKTRRQSWVALFKPLTVQRIRCLALNASASQNGGSTWAW